MTKTVNFAPACTAVANDPNRSIVLPLTNFDADYNVLDDSKAGTVIFTDLTTPLDQPWTVRFSQSPKKNIYAGSDIDPSAYLANKAGTEVYVETRGIVEVLDASDPAYRALAPIRGSIGLTLPVGVEFQNDDEALYCVYMCLNSLFKDVTIKAHDSGFASILRGALHR